ncbi:MAG: hypothetical protein QG608_810 [Actinomycetota bacterium]|nr:hypothetical protein [Actinomycetota bacterium]
MIPVLLILRIRSEGGRTVRLWLPLILLWVLLLPIALPVLIVLCLIALARGGNPLRVPVAGWQILRGLRGLVIDIDEPDSTIYLKIV